MKSRLKWIVSASLSSVFTFSMLIYLYQLTKKDICLDSGGQWLGFFQGCNGAVDEGYYAISPIAIVILVIFWIFLTWIISYIYAYFRKVNSNT